MSLNRCVVPGALHSRAFPSALPGLSRRRSGVGVRGGGCRCGGAERAAAVKVPRRLWGARRGEDATGWLRPAAAGRRRAEPTRSRWCCSGKAAWGRRRWCCATARTSSTTSTSPPCRCGPRGAGGRRLGAPAPPRLRGLCYRGPWVWASRSQACPLRLRLAFAVWPWGHTSSGQPGDGTRPSGKKWKGPEKSPGSPECLRMWWVPVGGLVFPL